MKILRAFRFVALYCSLAAAAVATSEPPIQPLMVKDVAGTERRVPDPHQRATVLIFIGRECPISNSYSPEIARLCLDFEPRKIVFLLVDADASSKTEDTANHAKEFRYPCPVVIDRGSALARLTGVTVTPEVAVLTPEGALYYRGRIDDRYADLGVHRQEPTTRDLRDALDALVAGKPAPNPRTRAVGCILQLEDNRP